MKHFRRFAIAIIGVLFLSSCNKSSAPNNSNNSGQQSDVKITAHFTPYTDGSGWSHSLSGSIKLEVKDNSGNSKGILYCDGTNAVDFGNMSYGSYTVNASYVMYDVYTGSGNGTPGSYNESKSQNFTVNSSSTTFVDVELP